MKPGDKVKYIGGVDSWRKITWQIIAKGSLSWFCQALDGPIFGEVEIDESLLELITNFQKGDHVRIILDNTERGIWELVEIVVGSDQPSWNCKHISGGPDSIINKEIIFFNEKYMIPLIKEQPNTCTCPITSLLAYGCKCGQMERERNEAHTHHEV